MIGGESKKTKSYRRFTSLIISFICAELRIPIELLGSLPLGRKSRVGSDVV